MPLAGISLPHRSITHSVTPFVHRSVGKWRSSIIDETTRSTCKARSKVDWKGTNEAFDSCARGARPLTLHTSRRYFMVGMPHNLEEEGDN